MSLLDLMNEINAGVEIFFTGRAGQVYLNSSFILCDDYTELLSKLFLIDDNALWSSQKTKGGFKNYHDVITDVQTVVSRNQPAKLPDVVALHGAMKLRRKRRNEFFHSTNLLDLNVRQNVCVDAFCDLMSYGKILFPATWEQTVGQASNLDTLHILLQLEKCAASDPAMKHRYDGVLSRYGRTVPKPSKDLGYNIVVGDDFFFRLTVLHGGGNLKAELRALLPP